MNGDVALLLPAVVGEVGRKTGSGRTKFRWMASSSFINRFADRLS